MQHCASMVFFKQYIIIIKIAYIFSKNINTSFWSKHNLIWSVFKTEHIDGV